ncbi:aminoglycoside phosphotransferase family protein [Pelagibius litoralis]|uniref:Aminoglycoside phosphotransferase family protein n=1 Tax=Pelagibius litoralis TaxID=374515 RepID=A0A967EYI6_9PROT|nr:aminoglycoside phosphotransferase family protein [Pelagibius litoralis]NIA69680.1 aminoglycoside phosphotransferase family protein [Pelagibius litoralis]
MMNPAMDVSRDIGQPDPETVAALLQPDYGQKAFARFCGAEDYRIERMYFSTSKPLSLHCQARLPDGMEQTVFAQWVGTEAVSFAQAEISRLQKSRCGQLRKEAMGALLGDAASGLVLRAPGLDARLPGLRMLHSRQTERDFALLSPAVTAMDVTLRGHRLGKRAVLQFDLFGADPRQVFVKLRPVSSNAGRRAHDRHVALFERLRGAVALPKPLGYDPDCGASVISALPGVPPDFESNEPTLIAEALRRLQQVADLPVESHTAADELALLEVWCDRAATVFPDRAGLFTEAFDRVCKDLLRLPDLPPVPCHRDFHEGQILINDNAAGFLDFDTLRVSDPALDPGNLIAHLRLAETRTGRGLSAAETAITAAMHPVPANRISAWTRAALLRLAAIYSFTSEPRETLQKLLEDVVGGTDDRCLDRL